MPDQAPQTTHEHDYRPTKAGTYWKVCACGARKHFTSHTQTTQGDAELRAKVERLIGTAILKNDKNYTDDMMAIFQAEISKQREQARQEGRNEVLDEVERLTQGTVCLYHHAQGVRGLGIGCGCTTEIDRGALDSFIAAQRKEDKKGD